MTTVVITPPATGLVSLQDAKTHLRVEDGDSDSYIEALIAAASGMIDGPYGYIGRAIITQTLELTRDEFYCEVSGSWARIPLPCPPALAITSVKYTDSAGDEQTVDAATYRLSENALTLATGASWPTPANESGAVRIRYTAGFGAITDVPAPIRAAALLMIGNLWANREAVSETQAYEMPLSLQALLNPYRVITV